MIRLALGFEAEANLHSKRSGVVTKITTPFFCFALSLVTSSSVGLALRCTGA